MIWNINNGKIITKRLDNLNGSKKDSKYEVTFYEFDKIVEKAVVSYDEMADILIKQNAHINFL